MGGWTNNEESLHDHFDVLLEAALAEVFNLDAVDLHIMRKVIFDFFGHDGVGSGDVIEQASDILLIGEGNLFLLGVVDIFDAYQVVVLLFQRFLIEDFGEPVGNDAGDLVLYLGEQA